VPVAYPQALADSDSAVFRCLESAARRPVLHASQVRALAAANHFHGATPAGRDSRHRRDHGESLVARPLLELTKPRITQLVLLTASLAALTFASYVLLYTPLKRRTSLNTLIGAVPGALPIVGGWTAAGGNLDVAVAALFWILFLWQLPHFLALAWIYREDYRAAGLAMLSATDADGSRTGRMALLYATALLPVSLLPTLLGVTGSVYFFGALAIGLAYAGVSAGMSRAATTPRAWRLLLASIVYLPALLTLMVLDKVAAYPIGAAMFPFHRLL